MLDSRDPKVINPIYKQWISVYDQLLAIHEQYQQLVDDEYEKQVDDVWFQDLNSKFVTLNENIQKWFTLNQTPPAEYDNKSGISRTSRRSRGSSTVSSQLSTARLKEEQRKAELLARAKSLANRQELEEQKLKLRHKEEELDIKVEMDVSDAKVKVIEALERSMIEDQELEEKLRRDIMAIPKQQMADTTLNPNVPEWVPREMKQNDIVKPKVSLNVNRDTNNNRTTNVNNVQQVTQPVPELSNSSIARELNKPRAEIKKFDGNPMIYKSFLRQFNTRIVINTDSYEELLTYLLQFTVGEPHRIVNGFSHLDAKIGYQAALDEFKDRYGDPDVIAHSFVKKALDWPLIKQDNSKELDEYAIFLMECLYAVENIEAVKVLEYSENLKYLVKKLPYYLQEKWRNIVYETKAKHEIVKFKQLVEFVKREAKKANDPVYGKDVMRTTSSVKRLQENIGTKSQSFRTRKAFTTTAAETDRYCSRHESVDVTITNRYNSNTRSAFTKPCVFCESSNHALDKCDKIVKQCLKDRYNFLRSKGYCFACLKPGHQKTSCRQKFSCSICGKVHLSILHVEPRVQIGIKQPNSDQCKQATNSTTCMGAGDNIQQALPILPVRVKSVNSDKYIETYAFIDSGSTATFCSERIMHNLNLEGKKTKLNLITKGQNNVHDCFMLTGLEISDLYGNNVLSLPPIFSQESLPVTGNDIVATSDIYKWPHLREIPLQRIDDDHIGLLIGINVPKAMEPWNVVPSVNNGPFAVETLLGWVINGPLDVSVIDEKLCKVVTSNRIDATVVSLEDQIRNQFNHDFNERAIDDSICPSKENRQFQDLVSKSISIEAGHYVINLPFKVKDNIMPNNRQQAQQRLALLARRFERDKNFHEEYVTFMSKIIQDGYSSIVSQDDLMKNDGRIWYLPHHGVYHPRKNKLRVVFDCAARFKGTSLNERLLQGPNLTNTLVGVLIRFRQEEVALMGDIDSMFHQVRVPCTDASYLRFLWWQNGDIKKEPTEYQMNVHLFGATSSPSCVNYALRKTAEDSRGQFNDEIINTVLRNFYVDDCLKSVKNVNDAIWMVKDLQALLSSGGFKIAKWTSNSRDVMKTIPMSDRAKEVKDLDLDQNILPIDRALGVQWCIETDTFRFKVSLKEKPKTRRGILSMVSSVYDPLGFLAPFMLQPKYNTSGIM